MAHGPGKKEKDMRSLRSINAVAIAVLAAINIPAAMQCATISGAQQPTVSLSRTLLVWFYYPGCHLIAPEAVTLTNNGPGVLDISSIAITNGVHFSQTNNCGSTLVVGQSCSITVTWHPSYGYSSFGSLSITDNGVASPQSVSLKGYWICPK